jgi:starch synthase (maltosyl-transferring)
VADYHEVNPLFVDTTREEDPSDQLKKTIASGEALGLRFLVDLVINHCSVDSGLITSNPEWFVWDKNGGPAHPFAFHKGKKVIWKDLARFDHKNTEDKEGLLRFFSGVVEYMIFLGFRGFRCDAAYQVPASLWKRLIAETKNRHPGVFFFAETLGCKPDQTRRTAAAGFDYIFNSSKWWDFNAEWLMKQYALTRDVSPSISFPESHDTLRLCEELDGNVGGLKQRYLFAAWFSAGIMIPVGFEFGFRKKLHVVRTRPEDWESTDIDLTAFIAKVNRLKAEEAIFQEEAPTEIIRSSNPNVLVMWKGSNTSGEESLLILNKDPSNTHLFHTDGLQEWVGSGVCLHDVSPEPVMTDIRTPFSYELGPGQGIVLLGRPSTGACGSHGK